MRTFFLDPFTADFMTRALVAVLALSVAGPLCGCWITQRRLVYLADAMSHAILAGVAAAALLGVGLLAGAMVAALVMAAVVSFLVTRVRISEDSAIGVTGQGLLALGVIGVSASSDPRALSHVLFGDPLTVDSGDVAVALTLSAFVVVAAWFLHPSLSASTFDAVHARTVGVRVRLVDAVLLLGLGIVVVIGLTTVGVLMSVVLVVAPPTAARMCTRRMSSMMPLSVVLGAVAGIAGLLASYHGGVPSGPAIALCCVIEVALAALSTRWRRRTTV